jgi:hypothetical protein
MRRAVTLIELMVIFSITIILVGMLGVPIISLCGGAFPDYSEGVRSGVIYKVSKKGFIWKSTEAEMNLGGMSADANGQVMVNTFRFSVRDEAVRKAIEEASNSGKRVTVHYHQYGIRPAQIDTKSVVDKVEYIH